MEFAYAYVLRDILGAWDEVGDALLELSEPALGVVPATPEVLIRDAVHSRIICLRQDLWVVANARFLTLGPGQVALLHHAMACVGTIAFLLLECSFLGPP